MLNLFKARSANSLNFGLGSSYMAQRLPIIFLLRMFFDTISAYGVKMTMEVRKFDITFKTKVNLENVEFNVSTDTCDGPDPQLTAF